MPKSLYSIVGMQFRPGGKAAIAAIKPGAAMRLARDKNNRFDRNAVAVYLGDKHVAFIKATEARTLASEMDGRGIGEIAAKFALDGGRWPHAEVDWQ